MLNSLSPYSIADSSHFTDRRMQDVRQGLAKAVQMTGAQGVVITYVTDRVHMPLLSIDLSKALMVAVAQQMGGTIFEEGISARLIQFSGKAPLFAICVSVRAADWPLMVSFVMSSQNQLEQCSLTDLERLTAEITALLAPVKPTGAGYRPMSWGKDQPVSACCSCDCLQNDLGQWVPWHRYVTKVEGRMLSHTFCPSCFSSNFPELAEAC
ncbi:MAG: hypothetical protein JWO89_751 [Verrucomicrobiaceae bacterium]|nr:hypothetical protein [Verrucomicrobiaceae bacterium]